MKSRPCSTAFALILAAILFAWVSASPLQAMFAPYTDRELIEKSDVIVLGEFIGQTEVRVGGAAEPLSLGVIAVREMLKGNPQEKIVLIAVPSPSKPISGSDIVFRPKQEGLWLVTSRPGGPSGIYVADHPQRFVPSGRDQSKIDALRKALRSGKQP